MKDFEIMRVEALPKNMCTKDIHYCYCMESSNMGMQ